VIDTHSPSIGDPERACAGSAHYGSPPGSVGTEVGIGGNVGSGGVFVGAGVGGVEIEGTGAFVGGFVWLGGTVGAATEGDAAGVTVRKSVGRGDMGAGPGRVCGGSDPIEDDAEGDAVAAGASLGEF
jgi:hypothetical protein